MTFYDCLLRQAQAHPSSQPRDFIKQCYQAARGGDHLLSDFSAARSYFYQEWEQISPADGPLYEWISPSIARVNLAPWKQAGLPKDWLFSMFAESSALVATECGTSNALDHLLHHVTDFIEKESHLVSFSPTQWQETLKEYEELGKPAVHHSPEYRLAEGPAYRIVHQRYIRLVPLLQAMIANQKVDLTIIAIDGPAASGKSSVASDLSNLLGCPTIHMDDFFLPPDLRTDVRLSEAGGNIHYERFLEEVVAPLTKGESKEFSYRIFDCSEMDYNGLRDISPESSPWLIVEGSYSHHPKFGDYAHITAFCRIDKEVQMERILARNGEEMAHMFKTRWIPMEDHYFHSFQIENNSIVKI